MTTPLIIQTPILRLSIISSHTISLSPQPQTLQLRHFRTSFNKRLSWRIIFFNGVYKKKRCVRPYAKYVRKRIDHSVCSRNHFIMDGKGIYAINRCVPIYHAYMMVCGKEKIWCKRMISESTFKISKASKR